MLQIKLSKGPSESGGGSKSVPVETVTVACPDHLVLADLPVAKSLGSVTSASLVKTIGRRSRRHLGERVHFCVRCDFPIAIYGRLSPCEHAFCLDCARSDSICYLCDDRIQKIQTIKMMEGIFICAAPHCLKSFLKKAEFESHIHENHADLLQPITEKDDGNESEVQSVKQSAASESSVKAPVRSIFSPNPHSQPQDREDTARRPQPREPPLPRPALQRPSPHFGQAPSQSSDQQVDSRPPGFDRPLPQNRFQQQGVDMQSGLHQESGLISDKPQCVLSDTPIPEHLSQHPQQPPNFVMPISSNPPFNYLPFPTEGVQQIYGVHEMPHPDLTTEGGPEQGSVLGFPPSGPPVGLNFPDGYQRWNMGPNGLPFDAPLGQGTADGFTNSSDSQRVAFPQGEYGRSPGGLPMNPIPPHFPNQGMESLQGNNSIDMRDGKGILAPQPPMLPPPPPLPPHASHKRGKVYSGDMGRDGQGF